MTPRRIFSSLLLLVLISALYTAISTTGGVQAMGNSKAQLENVRDYTPVWLTRTAGEKRVYAVDGGYLFVGSPNHWSELTLPVEVIASSVAVDPFHPTTLYVGAANELAIYLSRDSGASWERIRFDTSHIGGVTDLAINGAQRTLYVATDTAGIFRLRDVGTSMILSGHTMMDEAILEVATDQLGAGLVFARTEWTVYHGVNNGQQWLPLDGLNTVPTALAVANTIPAVAYIGTTDRGLLKSSDGVHWEVMTEMVPTEAGTRVQVSAVAIDPVQPNVIYAAMNYLFGGMTVHQSPIGVVMSTDNGRAWRMLTAKSDVSVVELMPVIGQPGAVFALTSQSRTPLALGTATDQLATMGSTTATSTATVNNALISAPLVTINFVSWLVAATAAALLMWFMYQEWQHAMFSSLQAATPARIR